MSAFQGTVPDTMTAAVFDGAGGPEVITTTTLPTARPAEGEVLIRVVAAGLNRADVQQRRGLYPPPPGASDVPGLEVSGTIVARGDGVDAGALPDGTEVCALLAGGGYAEYVAAPAGQVLTAPTAVDLVAAAGLPEVAATVVSNLSMTVTVEAGQWVLVHGASGGIGTFALQYLRELGARTIATGSTPDKLEWARAHGAAHTIDYTAEDFAARVAELTAGRGADAILDVVGAAYLDRNVRALADGGRLVVIGLQGGNRAELDLDALVAKRAGVIGTAVRSRPLDQKAAIVSLVREKVWPLVEAGRILAPVDRTFPLGEAAAAHEYFDSGSHRGKVLLTT